MKHAIAGLSCALIGAGLLGCNRTDFPDYLPANQTQVNEIRNNSGLTAQEKRDALVALGFDDLTINALLKSERTGNQLGGTLRTAYDKVVNGQYDQMTPDEVQLYGDATAVATIDDATAQAIVTLFRDQSITSKSDLQTFLTDPARDLPDTIDATTLTEIFVNFNPNDIIDKLP